MSARSGSRQSVNCGDIENARQLGGGAADGVDDEIHNSVGQDGDNEADDGVHDGILGIGNLFAIATRDDVAKAAVDEHNNGDDTDGVKDGVSDLGEDAINADKFGGHTIGASNFSAGGGGVI